MKIKMITHTLLALIIAYSLKLYANEIVSCPQVQATSPYKNSHIKNNYPLNPMGSALPDKEKRTTKFKIAYHTKGLEYENACQLDIRLTMLDQYIEQLKLLYPHLYLADQDPLLESYRAHALEMLSKPKAYGEAIDQCFAETLQRWSSCGGRFAQTAREMKKNANKLRVQAMTSVFFVTNSTGGNIWAAGLASTDQRSMFAVTSSIFGNTKNLPYVNTFKNIVCWEMGNNFAMNMGYYPRSLKGEVGFQSPCKILKK
jgi:hypothetical protein